VETVYLSVIELYDIMCHMAACQWDIERQLAKWNAVT